MKKENYNPETAPRVDNNKLFKLISELISCGFRGSCQFVANGHCRDYLREQGFEISDDQ